MQQLAQVLKFSTINESFRKKNDPKSKTLVLFQFLVGGMAASVARAGGGALPSLLRVQRLLPGQRPGGLQARVESYALRRHRRSTAASRRRARGARSELPLPTRPWRARRPPWQGRAPTAEAAEISTFWLIKLGNQLGRGDSQKLF